MVRATVERGDGVLGRIDHDRGHRDPRLFCQQRLCRGIGRVTHLDSVPVSVGVHGHIHEVRVVERGCGSCEFGVSEAPAGRPVRPQGLSNFCAVGCEPGAAPLGVQVVLVPVPLLEVRQCRSRHGGSDVLDQISGHAHQTGYQLRPHRGDAARRAPTPVVARNERPIEFQPQDQLFQIVRDRRLLARPHRLRIDESSRPEAAQVRHHHVVAGSTQQPCDIVVATRVVRKAV